MNWTKAKGRKLEQIDVDEFQTEPNRTDVCLFSWREEIALFLVFLALLLDADENRDDDSLDQNNKKKKAADVMW